MNHEERIEGNKLIALFMGYAEDEIQAEEWCGCNVLAECAFTGEKSMVAAAYDSSWSWLMPVLEKITSLNPKEGKEHYWYAIYHSNCRIWANTSFGISWEYQTNAGSTIESVWQVVIAFIKWHQTQTV